MSNWNCNSFYYLTMEPTTTSAHDKAIPQIKLSYTFTSTSVSVCLKEKGKVNKLFVWKTRRGTSGEQRQRANACASRFSSLWAKWRQSNHFSILVPPHKKSFFFLKTFYVIPKGMNITHFFGLKITIFLINNGSSVERSVIYIKKLNIKQIN
jgi:hypothetical protein